MNDNSHALIQNFSFIGTVFRVHSKRHQIQGLPKYYSITKQGKTVTYIAKNSELDNALEFHLRGVKKAFPASINHFFALQIKQVRHLILGANMSCNKNLLETNGNTSKS